GGSLSSISGFGFASTIGGAADPSITVTNFQSGSSQISGQLSINSAAALGSRYLLLTTGGGTVATNLLFTVNEGNPSGVTISPLGATVNQGNVSITLTVNSATSNLVTATANISGSALVGSDGISITRSGLGTFNLGPSIFDIY